MTTSEKDSTDYIPAINRIMDDIHGRETEIAEMKRTVNRLCGYAKLPIKFPQIEDPSEGGGVRIKAGQFYKKALATAVAAFLKMRGDPNRGGEGPGTLDEIYAALVEGGFIFNADSDATAKRSLAIALAKNSQTFEKLPTGQIGLKAWYKRDE